MTPYQPGKQARARDTYMLCFEVGGGRGARSGRLIKHHFLRHTGMVGEGTLEMAVARVHVCYAHHFSVHNRTVSTLIIVIAKQITSY